MPPLGSDAATTPGLDADRAEALLGHLTSARWFAGKGRAVELTSLIPLPWLTELDAWPAVRTEVVEVGYRTDADPDPEAEERWPSEVYQVVASYRKAPVPELGHAEIGRWTDRDLGPVVVYDGAQDPEACRVLLRNLLAGRRLTDRDQHDARDRDQTEIDFRLALPGVLRDDLEPTTFRGQQSNTSIMLGDVGMIKLFRRLELGRNLDIEVHDALRRAGVHDVATLYGWVEAGWTSAGVPVRADLAMAVEKLARAEDGWELALGALEHDEPFTADARALGVALAEIHDAMAETFPTSRLSGSAVATIMRNRLAAATEIAPALEPYVPGLTARFDELAAADLPVQRVHGDFHLGQTLRTPTGWKIIDFEGEPAKTLAERTAPDSRWRDVAGMLRSFDYAGASRPGPNSAAWARDCREAFLEGYAGGPLADSDVVLLAPYEADKAIYEVIYEVRNRPDWVSIPLAAVAGLAAPPDADPQQAGTQQDGTQAGTQQSSRTKE